jgi:hypothetical protein
VSDETPTQAIVRASAPQDVTLDANGRKILVRVMTPVEQFRFKKVIGKFMDNGGYMMDAMMAASVRAVDGMPMPFPQSEANVEFILERLATDGWAMVQDHFMSLANDDAEEIDAAKN